MVLASDQGRWDPRWTRSIVHFRNPIKGVTIRCRDATIAPSAALSGHASLRRGSGNRLDDRRVTESGRSRSSRESPSRMDTSIHT